MTENRILEIIKEQKSGNPLGIFSVCSSNEFVIRAYLKRAKEKNSYALIEATANQVNQYGGYTGLKPEDFVEYIYAIAQEIGIEREKIILGGDHLGPLVWCGLPENEAMEKAIELVREYVLAGFTKIHIDTSMKLGGDQIIDDAIIAKRGVILVKAAKEAYLELKEKNCNAQHPMYIIGSEVPIPGGSTESEEIVEVTKADDFEKTVSCFKFEFEKAKLQEEWKYVVGVVVQPGVEFGDEDIHEYDRNKAYALIQSLRKYNNIVFEGHSTDYQTKYKLKEMVEDGIAILKVGPALTFAFREAVFSLSNIEDELGIEPKSNFVDVLDRAMLKNPSNWIKHYSGNEKEVSLRRKYSLSDRSRYYFNDNEVIESLNILIKNLNEVKIPLSILRQYMPVEYNQIRNSQIKNNPVDIIIGHISNTLDEYFFAINE